MASAQDDTSFQSLPAAYQQQVMNPSGQAARQDQSLEAPSGVPNGTGSALRRSAQASDEAYERALSGTGSVGDAVRNTGSDAMDGGANLQAGLEQQTQDRLEEARERPLLPHATLDGAQTVAERETRATTSSFFPSPFPSPMSTSLSAGNTTELTTTGQGNSLAQHGAAAIRWISKLGDYMQRRSTTVSRTQPGVETTVVQQETVWSPAGSQTAAATSEEPLFSGAQVRRMREMATAAPQLYGSSGAAASSDTSGSYTRDQLEMEVRKQVKAALSGQQGLMEENQRLRLEIERLVRASASLEGPNPPLAGVQPLGALPGLSVLEASYQEAIHQDFVLYNTKSKEAFKDFRVIVEYLKLILEDY